MARTNEESEISWVEAEKDYSLGVNNGKLVCQNSKGKTLKSVPKWLKETELGQQFLAACEWLIEHDAECRSTVETWMLRSLPVPREVIEQVWPDQAWQKVLKNLVVYPIDSDGLPITEKTGLLLGVSEEKGIGIVDCDGETEWIQSDQLAIPHPILINDRQDLTELAADLDATQSIEQLFRPLYASTSEQKKKQTIDEYSNGLFEQLTHCTSACKKPWL